MKLINDENGKPIPIDDWMQLTRDRLNMTQKELAAALGVCTRTIQHYEAGHRTPGGSVIKLLQRIVNERTAYKNNQ